MRLNKILADAGLASRRGAEVILAAGRVAVDGTVVTDPGAQADPAREEITVDGRPLAVAVSTRHVYVMLNKPVGVVTTARDPQGRPTALALVDRPERLFSVGRLDRDTEGLLLLTNDGDWANSVAHPGAGVEKEYEVTVDGVPTRAELERFVEGVPLPDGHVAHGEARVLERLDDASVLALTLHEGHKRQARLMFGVLGYPVRRLVRVRVGGLSLGHLTAGAWRDLSRFEVGIVMVDGRHETQSGHESIASAKGGVSGRGGGERDGGRGRDPDRRGDGRERNGRAPGDRDRRPGGVGQVDGRPGRGRGAGPALPRHGGDVSRGDVARPPKGRRSGR